LSGLGAARGKNRNLVKASREIGHGFGEVDGDFVGCRRIDFLDLRNTAQFVAGRDFLDGIEQPLDGVLNVVRVKRSSVGKLYAAAQLKRDGLALARDFPRCRQRRLGLLGFSIDAEQGALRQVTEAIAGLLGYHQRVERLRIGA